MAGMPKEAVPSEPVTTLRGARVTVDARRTASVVAGIYLVTLLVAVVALFAAAVHRNGQISRLRHDGVAVVATVSGCEGMLGGSGSNVVGDVCRGSFTLGGRRDVEVLPGSAFHAPGAHVRVIAAPGDPPLLATPHDVATARASASAFTLPAILCAVLVLSVAGLAVARRRKARVSAVSVLSSGL